MTRELLFSRFLAALFAIAVSFTASHAFADEAAAAEYYQQATEAYQAGDLRKAADLLDKAFGQHPDLVYKYNRILALQGLGEYELALSELNTMYGPMKNDAQNRFDNIDEIRAQLEGEVEKSGGDEDPPDETTGDGDGDGDGSDTIEEPEPAPKKGANIPAFALLGLGGASFVAAVITGSGLTLTDRRQIHCYKEGLAPAADELFGEQPACFDLAFDRELAEDEGFYQDEQEAFEFSGEGVRTAKTFTLVFIGVGVVSSAVGAVLLLTGTGSGGGDAPPASAGVDSIKLLPYIGQGAGGAVFQMRF